MKEYEIELEEGKENHFDYIVRLFSKFGYFRFEVALCHLRRHLICWLTGGVENSEKSSQNHVCV